MSGSGLELNLCQIWCLGCQYTIPVHSGMVQWTALNQAELGWLSVSCSAGPSVDSYNAFDFVVG